MATNSAPTLVDEFLALRRHARLIFLTITASLALAGAYLLHRPAHYTSTGILLFSPSTTTPALPENPTQAADSPAWLASQSALITSLPALQAMASQLNLAQNPEFQPPPSWWQASSAAPQRLTNAIAHALRVSIPANSRLLAVSFTSANAGLSANAANLAMQLYLNQAQQTALASLTQSQSWLQSHQAELQNQLNRTESALAAARQQAGIVPGTQGDLAAETASHLAASLVDAQAALAMAQARLAAATQNNANAAIAPNLLLLRKEQADDQSVVDALSSRYGPDYPDLITARAALAGISAEINAQTARSLAAARADVAADQAQLTSLSNALAGARAQSALQASQSAPVQALSTQAQSLRAMLGAIATQADALSQQAALSQPAARIISLAAPAAQPNPSHGLIILLAALALGTCTGILLAGLVDALDTSFRSAHQLQDETGLNCLAAIPETLRPQFAALDAPFSLFAEQMRSLRTSLTLTANACVLAITAARPSEGKTTLTVSLGRALAACGLEVLVIDADTRQPSFESIFETADTPGLTDHLAGYAGLDAITLRDSHSPLHLITAGTQTADAISLFLSPRFPAMLQLLHERYDFVLIDVPPVFALAEARLLTRAADATLFCIRWGHTPRRVVNAALAILATANVRIAGTVLTRVNAKRHRRSGFADAEIYLPRYGGYFRARNKTPLVLRSK